MKSLTSAAEYREFVGVPRLTMMYFKPEVELPPRRMTAERTFLDAAKNVSEYLRWGYDVRVGKMKCGKKKKVACVCAAQ